MSEPADVRDLLSEALDRLQRIHAENPPCPACGRGISDHSQDDMAACADREPAGHGP